MFGCWMLVVATVVAIVFVLPGTAKDVWEKPGCHKVGHTRKISIPGCVEFHMRTNACRGFCESYAIPSGPKANPEQPVTSVGQCCNIMDTEDVEANVLCVDGMKTLTFKSATSCACYHCKKD
uniref:Glycoprotein hormone alpha 2 n=1 Tax=Carabus violaceus TaxID=41075 RepID=A0A7U3MC53_CARVO|nr:glycoprotein hormone alpha 2 [Carabus violaceus]